VIVLSSRVTGVAGLHPRSAGFSAFGLLITGPDGKDRICYSPGMKPGALLFSILLMALAAVSGCQVRGGQESSPSKSTVREESARARQATGQFDYYLLNLSWSPEFCHTHPTAIECAAHPAFVLHGLWPENNDGSYPQHCSSAPGPPDPSKYRDIYPDPSLLQHEWTTHGTCSGLSPDAYFTAARKAFQSVRIPGWLSGLTGQTSMPPDQILGLFTAANPQIPRAAMALTCGNNYLTAVEVCLDKNLSPIACNGVRSCRANTVRIPPP
jgi:ribonuclease T2